MSVRNLSVYFFPFTGEKGREAAFVKYAYAFHLLFNFYHESLGITLSLFCRQENGITLKIKQKVKALIQIH